MYSGHVALPQCSSLCQNDFSPLHLRQYSSSGYAPAHGYFLGTSLWFMISMTSFKCHAHLLIGFCMPCNFMLIFGSFCSKSFSSMCILGKVSRPKSVTYRNQTPIFT